MNTWGWFIAIFIGMWLVQFSLTKLQMKNYQATIRRMSKRPSGYLGVGIQKQKIGIGVIAIVVTNENGTIEECEVMQGVTVFTRFKPFKGYEGMHINKLNLQLKDEPIDQAFKMAVDKIQSQRKKKQAG
jgi:glucitol operon activator protein